MKDSVFEPKCNQSGGFFLSRHILDTLRFRNLSAREDFSVWLSDVHTANMFYITKRASIHTVTIKAGSKKQL